MPLPAYLFLLLFFSIPSVWAQSAALDPDCVTLQPKETFTGYWANSAVGGMISTVAPLNWEVPEGAVFLNNIDTAGYGQGMAQQQPAAAFRQGPNFSLFNKSLFRMSGLRFPVMLFTKQPKEYPIMVARRGALFFFFPDSLGRYNDTVLYHAYSPKAFIYGDYCGWGKADLNGDSIDDIIAVEATEDGHGDSTNIGIWYHEDIKFKGDTFSTILLIPASKELTIPTAFNRIVRLYTGDIDRDGVPDLCFYDYNEQTSNKFITIVFGKRSNSLWGIDTVVSLKEHIPIQSFLFMDFLNEDRIPDLLVGTDDTIYCYSGVHPNFLRHGFNFDEADFKIPSPAKLDPVNYMGSGQGKLYDWGRNLYDAGNINGSGQHSLATLTGYVRNVSGLDGPTICFIYSGGRATDERADALFSDESTVYEQFGSMDTVNVSSSVTNILVGDYGYNAGKTGKIWYLQGTKGIPHKQNPYWLDVSNRKIPSSQLQLRINQSSTIDRLQIVIIPISSKEGSLTIRDLLGRIVYQVLLPDQGMEYREVIIPTTSFASGTYLIQYSEAGAMITSKIFISH